ncbi:Gti1/Pac2 family-domain-containing protein [Scleroderma yunnanense]
MQQKPTCTNVRIRSTRDAHKIFYAVQLRLLPMITRRLDADERLSLCSGCVYAWEERGPHTEITGLGIERFTEGRRWSPSRVRDEFLFYYEKYTPPTDSSHSGPSDKQPPRDWDPLVKQTYSVWVETEKGRRKWHLTAYFTQATVDQLGTIDDNSHVAELVVPEGTFQSTRVSKSRKGEDSRVRSDVLKSTSSSVTRTYAPFPSPSSYPVQPPHYPATSPSTFSQESCRFSTQPSHSSPYHSPAEFPQYSQAFPIASSNSGLPPIRSDVENIDYKMRRPSLPISSNCSSATDDRRSSADYTISLDSSSVSQRSPDYRDRGEQCSLSSAARHGMTISPDHEGGAEFSSRNVPPCSYGGGSSRSSPASHHGSPAGGYQSIHRSQDDVAGVNTPYTYSPQAAIPSYSFHGKPHISLPPAAQLLRSEPPSQLFEVTNPVPDDSMGIGPFRVDLAPLHSLQRSHPYRRDPVDDKALRMLGPRAG